MVVANDKHRQLNHSLSVNEEGKAIGGTKYYARRDIAGIKFGRLVKNGVVKF